MNITIKYVKPNGRGYEYEGNPIKKINIFRDKVGVAMHGYFFIAEDKYYYCDLYNYSLEVASSEAEFLKYLVSEFDEDDITV